MSKEERNLQTKIRMFEDILLRTKNPSQVDNIQMELTRMRAKLQKLYFKRMEPLLGLFLFFCVYRFATEVVLTNRKSYPRIAVERR